MKAISLWQPWASLVVLGDKEFETRSWATNYGGPLLIHAGKRKNIKEMVELLEYSDAYETGLISFGIWDEVNARRSAKEMLDAMPFGKIIGKVDLVGCFKSEDMRSQITEREMDFGDWTPGRYVWKFANPRMFDNPFEYTGELGLFNVPDNLLVNATTITTKEWG